MNVAVAIFAIGGMVGALPTGFVADSIGRLVHSCCCCCCLLLSVIVFCDCIIVFEIICSNYRKYTMLLNNVVVFVAVGLQSFAVHPFMFILGRFIVGINAGNTVLHYIT